MPDVTAGVAPIFAARLTALASGSPTPQQPAPTGFIVVRLSRFYEPRDDESLLDLVEAHPVELAALGRFLQLHGLTRSARIIQSVPVATVIGWEQEAARVEALRPLRSLVQYWRLDARGDGGPRRLDLVNVAAQLRGIDGVDMARVEFTSVPPDVDASDDGRSAEQTYLDAPWAPGGINARALWSLGYDGSGVGFVDVEYGWFVDHDDLADHLIKGLPNDVEDEGWRHHGTRTLGVVVGVDNDTGIVGIAPKPRFVQPCSVLRNSPGEFRADAILNAVSVCQPGDVVLLELQANDNGVDLPAEFEDDAFDAMRLAAALGLVVIEAAANGGKNLDVYPDANGVTVLKRGVRESGAIMVGASTEGSFVSLPTSNHGDRVDCFAPAEKVLTTDYAFWKPAEEQRNSYTNESDVVAPFGQTSAASAIIAGAAVLVQSMWKERTGSPLTSLQMRAVLTDPEVHTHPGTGSNPIGVMPDLGAIADAKLPDIYLRDTVTDDGTVPATGLLCFSPDIIVRAQAEADPTAAFGEGSGTEASADLSDDVVAGTGYHVYTRVRNRGGVDATGVTVSVYWAPPTTLVTPDLWNLIGTTAAFDVAANDSLVVSPPVPWPATAVPGTGHYCFVAVASQASDLAPTMSGNYWTWDLFRSLVSHHNNVAWRNFNVIDPVQGQQEIALDFVLAGDPAQSREFMVELRAAPRLAGQVLFDVPLELAQWLAASPGASQFTVRDNRVVFDLTRTAGLRLRRVILGPGARHDCRIILRPPWPTVPARRPLCIRQLHDGMEVGRITWTFSKRHRRRRGPVT